METQRTIEVVVARVPGKVETILIEQGKTVEDALSAVDFDVEASETIKVNGLNANLDKVLSNGDRITINKMVKGN